MDPRFQQPQRSAGFSPQPSPQRGNAVPPAGRPQGQMTRAEKFEDEKRRIIESCFSKYDDSGQLSESYITHIRVTEDSSFPQTPHPPDSPSANKARIIIVAVRNTGRVRVHKARENANYTFSIGKTWNLEDLSAVQSWNMFQPRNAEEETQKSWAGDTGFTVTMGKPYFWQASTAKEKEFFIASLVKIYRKYTQGKIPELIGFPQKDVEAMLGGGSVQQQGGPRNPVGASSPSGPAPQIPPFSPGRQQRGPLGVDGPTSPPGASLEPPPRNRPPTANSGQAAFFGQRSPSSQTSNPPPGSLQGNIYSDPAINRMPSREQMRPPGRITPSASMTNLNAQRPRDRTPDSVQMRPQTAGRGAERRSPSRTRGEEMGLGISGRPNGAQPLLGEQIPPLPRPGPPNGFGDTGRMRNGSQGSTDSLQDASLPERRRPPMIGAQPNGSQASFKSSSAVSLRPPGSGVANQASASTESLLKGRERMPGGFIPSPAPSQDLETDGLLPAPLSPKSRMDGATPMLTPETPSTSAVSPPASAESNLESTSDPTPVKSEDETKKTVEEEVARPGLGRMFGGNKKTAREMFKTAATAYGAFVPRPGGAGARLRAGGDEKEKDSDGISGVFQARNLNRMKTDDSLKSTESPKEDNSVQATPTSAKGAAPPPEIPAAETLPQVTVSSPLSPPKGGEKERPVLPVGPDPALEAAMAAAAAQKKAKLAEEERRKKRRSVTQMKYFSRLGVDSAFFEGKGLDFEAALEDIGWGTTSTSAKFKSVEALEADIRKEIARVEAGSWLGQSSLDQKDERIDAVEKLLDKAIAECDELDGLLTLYSVELSSLNDDIAFIEAQSQGLQVQTANQKLLQLELQNLLKTISIGPRELEPLKRPMPSTPQGLESIEQALLGLYKAMVTIDPGIRQNAKAGANGGNASGSSELSSMVALQEKSDQFLSECSMFLKRFTQHMDLTFGAAMLSARDIISRTKGANGAKMSTEPFDAARADLWPYSPLMLFAKELDRPSWDILMRMYQSRAKPLYAEEFSANVLVWKKLSLKLSTDETDALLFTHNAEKENENMAATARRITVKRSQTLARGLRQASSEKDKERSAKGAPAGSMFPFDAFKGALEEMTGLIAVEQNFIVDFFHATGTESIDFADAVAAAPPEARRGGNIYGRKAFEPDREMAKRVSNAMEDVFGSFDKEISALIKWATDMSPLQGIGIMYALNKTSAQYEDTNQDFLNRIIATQTQRLSGLWTKFVDDQVRAIEATKVKLDKRKGVVGFIKTFPDFSTAIENQLPPATDEPAMNSEVRAMVDAAYERINKAIFTTIRRLAKEIQAAGSSGAATLGAAREEIEEKNALNSHILLIENMNHYVEEVDARGDPVLEAGKADAREDFEDHLGVYVDSVVRRPLGKIMDFIDTITLAMQALPPTASPTSLATRVQTSRNNFAKMLKDHNARKPREKVNELTRRVEKHFLEGDEQNLSRELVNKVLARCEEKYNAVFEKCQELGREVYEGGVEGLDALGSRDDVARWFRGAR
ncbi:uncharacterized protein PV09_06182 [Verruconis gallopava]|uniref:Exocyst complex component Sec3 PIP2-binding N-terminal domain-containing protein n=1 Tax=Verruconis gallopava TaxID=253628 RepID=A0A0D2A6Z0_9PEZI|nr:uncharacterized protein PV09_06182 [Verruconis gallopava]KIW02360.1 hypothetical protein PV09_06182 [Verruconis gallopava]